VEPSQNINEKNVKYASITAHYLLHEGSENGNMDADGASLNRKNVT